MFDTLNITVIIKTRIKTMRLCWVVFFCVCAPSAFANDYKAGLSAYIDGNYSKAQQHWLNAAKAKDAKSMFNLGLLHEQNKIADASAEKANSWFSLSMDNGYPAAGYHMAQRMLERGGSDEQAIALIQRAADQSYAPAMLHLGRDLPAVSLNKTAIPVPDTSAQVSLNNSKQSDVNVDQNPVLARQQDSNTAWINRQAEKNWTIQLLAFTQKDQVERFVIDNALAGKAYFYKHKVNGSVFYKLLYGSYKTKIKAEFARQNLPTSLTQHGPWLRTLASVHQVTKNEL